MACVEDLDGTKKFTCSPTGPAEGGSVGACNAQQTEDWHIIVRVAKCVVMVLWTL